jgi:SsrA-binding protein
MKQGKSQNVSLPHNSITSSYEIIEKFTCGMKLNGNEVKALKTGKGSLKGSFIVADTQNAWLNKATIPPYQEANAGTSYNPTRPRKLLLHKHELKKIAGMLTQKGLTALPLEMYNQNGFITLSIALVRHLNKHDKREVLKERDAKKGIERSLKTQR